MNTLRLEAQKRYDAAVIASRKAEDISLEAYIAAKANLQSARTALIEMEDKYPTSQETQKRNNFLKLANRGLDVF